MFITDKTFWEQALERALKSAAQGAVAALGATQLTSIDQVITVAQAVGYAAASLFVLSILTSIVSAPIGEIDSPSLVETPVPMVEPFPEISDEHDFSEDEAEEDVVDSGTEATEGPEDVVDPNKESNI